MYIPSLSIILRPDYTNSNLYFHTLNRLLPGAFFNITAINTVINKYFKGVLSEMGNNLNTVIICLFLHTGTKFFNGRIFSLLPSLL